MRNWFLSRSQRQALRDATRLLEVNKAAFAGAVALGSIGLGAAVALGGSAAWLIARASQMPPVLYLEVAVVMVRMFGISKAVFRYLERLLSHRIAVAGMTTLRANVYRQLSQADPAQVAQLKRGDLLDRMGTEVDAVGDYLVKSLLPTVVAGVVGTATVLAITLINWQSGLALLVALLLAGVVAPLFSIRATQIAQYSQVNARKGINTVAMTLVDDATQIQISGQQKRIFQILANYEAELNRSKNQAAYPAATAAAVEILALLCALVAAAWYGIHGVAGQQVSEVMLAVLVLTPLAAFEATGPLAGAAAQWVVSAQAAVRIMELLPKTAAAAPSLIGAAAPSSTASDSPTVTQSVAPATDTTPITPPASGYTPAIAPNTNSHSESSTAAAALYLRQATLGWPGAKALQTNLDFTIEPGQHLAIVGPSGVGKTTLLSTLCGLIPPQKGSLTYRGQELSSLSREQAAQIVCLISEDAHIFATSVEENLRVARGDLSSEEAKQLLSQAGLGEWLKQLPDGLATPLESAGTTVSGGERRRLLLARGLASSAPILAFDEPTEHLDPTTADRLLRDLFTLDKAVLVVTHRLTGLENADRVFLLDAQGFTTSGTHQELLANCPEYRWSWEQEQIDVW